VIVDLNFELLRHSVYIHTHIFIYRLSVISEIMTEEIGKNFLIYF